jgi:aminopeptidase N
MTAASYVDAVARHAPGEKDLGVLATLLGNARQAAERYTCTAERSEVRSRLLATVVAELHAADAGSDIQLVWARTLTTLGRTTDAEHRLLSDLLDGTAGVQGLSIDSELRWRLLEALAATGRIGAERLDAELAADRTAPGRVGHRLASAALPAKTTKATAWESALNDSSLTNELLSATIEGFQCGPVELRTGYEPKYFAALRGVWERMSIELASRIVRGLYPLDQDLEQGQEPAGHPALGRSSTWLEANSDAPSALRRIVIEQQDALLRGLRAQQRAWQREQG